MRELLLGVTLLLAGCVSDAQVETEHAQQEEAVKAALAKIDKTCTLSYLACDQQEYDTIVRVLGPMNDDDEEFWRKRLAISEQIDKGQITVTQGNAMLASVRADIKARNENTTLLYMLAAP